MKTATENVLFLSSSTSHAPTLEHFTFYYSFTEQSPWTIQWHTPTTTRNFNPELYDGVRGFSEHCSFIVYKQNIYIFLFSLPTPLTVFRYFLSFSTQLHAWKIEIFPRAVADACGWKPFHFPPQQIQYKVEQQNIYFSTFCTTNSVPNDGTTCTNLILLNLHNNVPTAKEYATIAQQTEYIVAL